MRAKNERGLSLKPPGHRIAHCLGKAALKTHALQTLNAWSADSAGSAKRLECVRFIGAFACGAGRQWFMVAMHDFESSRLPITASPKPEWRMTKSERMTKSQLTTKPAPNWEFCVIRASDFVRHSTFDLLQAVFSQPIESPRCLSTRPRLPTTSGSAPG